MSLDEATPLKECRVDLLEIDIYRLQKQQLIEVLLEYGIWAHEKQDRVDPLREIAVLLKNLLREASSHKLKSHLLRDILSRARLLSDNEKLVYPKFAELECIVVDRFQGYLDYKENHPDPIYENIQLRALPPPSPHEKSLSLPQFRPIPSPDLEEEPRDFVPLPLDNFIPPKMPDEKLPLISAHTFAGLPSQNVNDFLEQYELAAESNHWTPDTKIKLFPVHLKDTALTWWQLYKNRNAVINWADLINEFKSTFTYAALAENLASVMAKKTHDPREPVLNFFLDTVSTCRRYKSDIDDKEIIRYFLQAVNPDYCRYLSTLQNDTLRELEQNLARAERFVSLTNQNRERYSPRSVEPHKPFENYSTARVQHVRFTEGEHTDLKEEIKNLRELVHNLAYHPRREDRDNPQIQSNKASYNKAEGSNEARTSRRDYARTYTRDDRPKPNNTDFRRESRSPTPSSNRVAHQQPPQRYCHICDTKSHETKSCWFNAKGNNPRFARDRPKETYQGQPYNGRTRWEPRGIAPNPSPYLGQGQLQQSYRAHPQPTYFAPPQRPPPMDRNRTFCRYCKAENHDITACPILENKKRSEN